MGRSQGPDLGYHEDDLGPAGWRTRVTVRRGPAEVTLIVHFWPLRPPRQLQPFLLECGRATFDAWTREGFEGRPYDQAGPDRG